MKQCGCPGGVFYYQGYWLIDSSMGHLGRPGNPTGTHQVRPGLGLLRRTRQC
jgi:hypothetical protein